MSFSLFPPSHIDQGLVFSILGVWHLLNTLLTFISHPSSFKSRIWFPLPFPQSLRCLELWCLLLIVVSFICKQLYRASSDLSSGVIHIQHLQRFQHVTFAFLFLVYVVAALCNEYAPLPCLPDGALNATFALGFMVELLVFHLGHHPGDNLESFVHQLMQLILAFLCLLMFLEILWPQSFLISVGRCMLLLLKGTWFFQIGLLINYPWAIPLGCKMGEDGFPDCTMGATMTRAKSLQVLVFGWQIAGIVVSTYVAYLVLATMDRKTIRKGIYEPVGSKIEEEEVETIPLTPLVPTLSKRKSQNARSPSNGPHVVLDHLGSFRSLRLDHD